MVTWSMPLVGYRVLIAPPNAPEREKESKHRKINFLIADFRLKNELALGPGAEVRRGSRTFVGASVAAQGSASTLPEAPGGSRKLPEAPGDSRRLPSALGCSWRLLEAPGASPRGVRARECARENAGENAREIAGERAEARSESAGERAGESAGDRCGSQGWHEAVAPRAGSQLWLAGLGRSCASQG